jgi:GNAT superfamily N-acetyltransferase
MRRMPTQELTIASMRTPEEATAFARLNEVWITQFFAMEPADRGTLDDPAGAVQARGGDVLIAREGERIVGCVALLPEGHGVYELTKMAVLESERGRGFGRRLMEAAIARARELGATSLFLGSNRRLAAAVALYESVGFRHVPPAEVGPLPYSRADVFMALDLR